MRLADEHQQHATRPNLFSAVRHGGHADAHILARLERNMPAGPARTARRMGAAALLAGAGVLIVGLLMTLVSLVRENAASPGYLRNKSPVVTQHVAPRHDPGVMDPGLDLLAASEVSRPRRVLRSARLDSAR